VARPGCFQLRPSTEHILIVRGAGAREAIRLRRLAAHSSTPFSALSTAPGEARTRWHGSCCSTAA